MYKVNIEKQEKVEKIIELISQGKTRTEVAKLIGYKSIDGLYKFTIRNNMKWNEEKGNYDIVKLVKQSKPVVENPTGKAGNIIIMFSNGMDGREIAKRLRFNSCQELGFYMKSQGYIWDTKKQNYIKQAQVIENNKDNSFDIKPAPKVIKKTTNDSLEGYIEMLEFLNDNLNEIKEIIKANDTVDNTIPRYVLPGVSVTKGFKITTSLEGLIREYSEENNISQKEIIEVALIEFLKKYGYFDEVKTVLKV